MYVFVTSHLTQKDIRPCDWNPKDGAPSPKDKTTSENQMIAFSEERFESRQLGLG